MAILVFAVSLAMILGFAAHRASICMVRTIAEIMSARTGYMLVSIGKSVLWVWAVTIPIFWLMPALGTGISGWFPANHGRPLQKPTTHESQKN